jgi:hypothetical protein
VKISEKKSTQLGLNAPQSHAVQVIHQEQRPRQLTSTEQIGAVVDQLIDEDRRKNSARVRRGRGRAR